MKKTVPRIMIAAPQSGSGKTLITCGLLKALKNRGKEVCSFKCGPDYIDPMFHKRIIGIPSGNLDLYFMTEHQVSYALTKEVDFKKLAVIEGVMGLYDGLGGITEEASSYHVARVTKTPIILVINAKGMARSVIALIAGFLNYDTEHLIKGVILNKTSGMFYRQLKEEIEKHLDIKVLGYVPDRRDVHLESRYLGLKLPFEIEEIEKQLSLIASQVEESVDLDSLIAIAKSTEEIESLYIPHRQTGRCTVAVARDEAFCFYYQANLEALMSQGAEIVYFSPLHDMHLPDHIHGLYFGGGYPELYAKQLSENREMLQEIKNRIESGMPSIAECGGFMYLHKSIETDESHSYPMVGVIDGECRNQNRLVRFGYAEYMTAANTFLPQGETIKGHEFHHFDSTCNGIDVRATKPVTKREFECVLAGKNHWWGFPHLYFDSNIEFVRRFIKKMISVN